ncbi:MAG: hypothetical protein CSB46_11230 [Micrococcales bacterium]|nr:MAG: hypothetical protein CSB46_11230 [Micrococcales bacterium]
MMGAPALIVCLSDPQAYLQRYTEPDKGWTDRDPRRWPVPYWDVDTGMAAMAMLLAAVNSGLGACFFGVPADRHDAVREAFAVPARLRLVGVISVGYPPAGGSTGPTGSARRPRRDRSEVVHRGRYGGVAPT